MINLTFIHDIIFYLCELDVTIDTFFVKWFSCHQWEFLCEKPRGVVDKRYAL